MTDWFIIPVFHPDTKVLTRLVESLRGHPLVLVNNDPTIPLQYRDEHVTTIENEQNLGFGGGVNVGLRYAFGHGALWMTALNQDLSMSKQGVADLVKTLSNTEPSITGPFGGTFDVKRWTTIVDESKGESQKDPEYISGSCVSIHRDVVSSIGYFYEPYFMYYEDADYSVRARRAGFPIISTLRSGITHHNTAIVGKGSEAHQYYLARNHMLFVERCASVGVKFYEFLRMPKTLSEHYSKGERGALLGIRDYALRTFGAYKKQL
jgi:N-acetylglucosaminyl-diphospho-decaprenol L-rhamnosyltransferase